MHTRPKPDSRLNIPLCLPTWPAQIADADAAAVSVAVAAT